MIVGLSVDSIGKNVVFSYTTPLRGLQEITAFVEDTDEVGPDRIFDKEFRFAMDGVRFSPWYTLTLLELQTRIHPTGQIDLKNDLVVEFKYTRAGNDNTGDLTINSVLIDGIYSFQYLQVLDFEDTVFEDLAWTDEYFNQVMLNLLDKVYKEGIVPSYVLRTKDSEIDDTDYITLWKTICYFYSLVIALVDNKVTNLYEFETLLSEFLAQRSLLICREENIEHYQDLANSIYGQIRRRGTMDVVEQDGNFTDDIVEDPKHGELLRMICYNILIDEFLFEYIEGGWFININSPTWYGLSNHLQLNKTPTNFSDITDISMYVDQSFGISLFADGSKDVIKIQDSGGYLEFPLIKINDTISYQFSFFVKRTAGGTSPFSLTFTAYDEDNFPLPFLNAQTGAVLNDMINGMTTQIIDSEYVWISGILFKSDEPALASSTLDIGAGNHLRMSPNTRKVVISMFIQGVGETDAFYVWDLKLTPHLNYQGSEFVNGIDTAFIWLVNNNQSFPDNILQDKIKQYLMPKGSTQIVTIL